MASNVEGCLAAGEYIEAWWYLKGWYRSAEERAPKPCPETLAPQTEERIQIRSQAKFALPPEEILGRREDGMSRGW
jgi:hypothetical protein